MRILNLTNTFFGKIELNQPEKDRNYPYFGTIFYIYDLEDYGVTDLEFMEMFKNGCLPVQLTFPLPFMSLPQSTGNCARVLSMVEVPIWLKH